MNSNDINDPSDASLYFLLQIIRHVQGSTGDNDVDCIKAWADKYICDERKEMLEIKKKYEELIMAVSMKHQNETRHDTALRYINQAENLPNTMEGKNDLP